MKHILFAFLFLAACATSTTTPSANTVKTAGACKDGTTISNIVFTNNAGVLVSDVEVRGRKNKYQPDGASSQCSNINDNYSGDLAVGQGVTFVVPADCAYHVDVVIEHLAEDAQNKDINVYLVTGCTVRISISGTTENNSWDNVKTSGTATDAAGYQCGKYGKSGL